MAAPAAASAKCPGNQGAAVKGVQGNREFFGSLLCCSALCKDVVLALPPFFPCLLGVEENMLGKALFFSKYGSNMESFCRV